MTAGPRFILLSAGRLTSLMLALLVCVPACTKPEQPVELASGVARDADFEAVWQAALISLREHSFTPDRQDRRNGVIRTRGETSGVFGEFWRKDSTWGYQLAESSLHTVQRIVTVQVTYLQPNEFQVEVEVNKQRWSLPERQVTGGISAAAAFSSRLPLATGEFLRPADELRAVRWVPLGRDGQLEERLLADILQKVPPGSRVQLIRETERTPHPDVEAQLELDDAIDPSATADSPSR